MALSRRTGQRFQGAIWPGFVDAMTGLLLVLMFVLTIFTVMQFVLRDTITGQESELDALGEEVERLGVALGFERSRAAERDTEISGLSDELAQARGAGRGARRRTDANHRFRGAGRGTSGRSRRGARPGRQARTGPGDHPRTRGRGRGRARRGEPRAGHRARRNRRAGRGGAVGGSATRNLVYDPHGLRDTEDARHTKAAQVEQGEPGEFVG